MNNWAEDVVVAEYNIKKLHEALESKKLAEAIQLTFTITRALNRIRASVTTLDGKKLIKGAVK